MGGNNDDLKGNETVLIADDDPNLLDIMARTVRNGGYTVITALDGQEAVDMYQNNISDIKLVVMDIIMSRKDGIAAYNEIMQINKDAAVLFITGSIKNIAIPGNPKIIRKPFTPVEFLSQIRSSIDGTETVIS